MGDMGDPPKKKRLISLCVGCGNQIHDQYILRVSPDLEWHAACLKCAECNQYLDESCTCFVRDGKTYCKRDYIRLYGIKCAKCSIGFSKNDFVMRARAKVYHIEWPEGGGGLQGEPPAENLTEQLSETAQEANSRIRCNEVQADLMVQPPEAEKQNTPRRQWREGICSLTCWVGWGPRSQNIQGMTGTPMVAASPERHDGGLQANPVEVQSYQPPWKVLSDFALQSDIDQPAFQQLVNFSEGGPGSNSTGSEVASMSSQLPDTPNSMVASPIEA
ncbi:PREDICTED: insulin gene enhancer protein ISL-1 [Myotis davidii]|uniref:insulin gene enhancer protein ISL-1 n=1 Tax=Myotis davidii TaxID=225400 RepID=UPI000767264D|nr:PREDICTED: insulin gene enhancer protein ISL-1 [Myotis davidii]